MLLDRDEFPALGIFRPIHQNSAMPKDTSNPISPDEPTFEQALLELEQIVRKLEEGQLGLSDSLGQYEAGVKRLQQCFAALEKAERRIEILSGVDAAGNPVTRPFSDDDLALEEKAGARSRRRSSKPNKTPPADAEDVDDGPALF
jgi:exodeoxyribonuclease VII small subunit